jgi:periplasmic divalent cation tolerance protein
MLIAWTTVTASGDADRLASGAVERGLAACVEVAAVTSHYRWRGKLERAGEYRLAFKCLPARLPELEAWVLGNHPYETPEWIVLKTERVSGKYLSWAEANSTPRPL